MNERIPLPVISCDDCGLCCHLQAGLPITWYTLIDPDAPLTPELRREVDETARRWNGLGMWQGPGEDAPCVWFDAQTNRCRHYEHRPEVCVEFEMGGADCLHIRERTS